MKPTKLATFLIALICSLFGAAANADDAPRGRVVFLGDSLTAGYGVEPDQAFPALVAEKIESAGLPFDVAPSGLSGETSAGGLRRASWVLQRPADVLVLALGANDGLRGLDLKDTRANLQAIIDLAREKYPDIRIVIAGMMMPPNLGELYTAEFRALYPALAEENGAAFVPFLLEGVGGHPELNLPDGIHPNPAGHRIVAENVWRALEPLLRAARAG